MSGKRGPRLAGPGDSAISPPPHLVGEALEEWNRVAPEMVARGSLDAKSRAALAAYCLAYARWVRAEAVAAIDGDVGVSPMGGDVPSVHRVVADKAAAQMRQWMGELGMTPRTASKREMDDGAVLDDGDEEAITRLFVG